MAKKKKTQDEDIQQEKEEKQADGAEQQTIEVQTEDGEEPAAAGEDTGDMQEAELADLSAEEVAELKTSLDESEEKAQEYLEGWQRSRAEFANYKKRIMREREEMYERAKGEVTKDYLDIADDLGRALQDRPESGEGAAWADGIELIYQKLQLKLEKAGVERMDAEGDMFDPNFHEAVFKEESEDHESGQVIEVLQEGYMIGDRVLRPALVRVAA